MYKMFEEKKSFSYRINFFLAEKMNARMIFDLLSSWRQVYDENASVVWESRRKIFRFC